MWTGFDKYSFSGAISNRTLLIQDTVIKTNFLKNLGRGLTIALFTLSSLSAVIYHEDAFAGKGGGKGGGNSSGDRGGSGRSGDRGGSGNSGQSGGDSESVDHSNSGNKPDPNFGSITSRESYNKWLSDLLK